MLCGLRCEIRNDERIFVALCLCRLRGKLTIGCAECQQLEAAFGDQSIGSVGHGVQVLLWDGCGREGGRRECGECRGSVLDQMVCSLL